MKLRTTLLQHGKTATGFEVPADVVAALGSGKRPAVRVTIGKHTYRSTVAPMGGVFLIDFQLALDGDASAGQRFESLSHSHKRQHVLAIEGAKTDETRQRRIAKAIEMLHEAER